MAGLVESFRKIERESELLSAIDSYVNLGENVKTPLYIKFCDGWGKHEVDQYLREKYKHILHVDGHPFKRGHEHFMNENGEMELIANHPELTANFLPPVGYDESEPPLFFVCYPVMGDYVFNPDYCLECVRKLNRPLVYFAPHVWSNHVGGNSFHTNAPEVVADFETIMYTPTIDGWLKDMRDEKSDFPNRKRVIDSARYTFGMVMARPMLERSKKKKIHDDSEKLRPHFLDQRIARFLDYADSIKELESYDNLTDVNPFNGKKDCKYAIPYLFEKLMQLYYSAFMARVLHPDMEFEPMWSGIYSLYNSFVGYLAKTEDNWVLDFSKPVPESVLKKVQDVLTQNNKG